MPIYAFRCRECGSYKEALSRETTPCSCGGVYRRQFSFSVKPDMPGHFNHAVGRYVSNEAEFKDSLKKLSEKDSKTFGVDVSYAPVDYSDRQSLGVTSEGLAETKQRRSELNMKPLKALENE